MFNITMREKVEFIYKEWANWGEAPPYMGQEMAVGTGTLGLSQLRLGLLDVWDDPKYVLGATWDYLGLSQLCLGAA